ncbi:hypothetical protein CYMTET_45757 [Cymbomonas tetramitiformis]|uniref:Uncharacterized protein n=1 Tax=Cymbomonas tetramitiformis TaxID=36881 RepID=A0AAE0EY03_9CHLO|nr:hypothetical protein CYMTET_45757 [Cymbomonas tetramitiformis]
MSQMIRSNVCGRVLVFVFCALVTTTNCKKIKASAAEVNRAATANTEKLFDDYSTEESQPRQLSKKQRQKLVDSFQRVPAVEVQSSDLATAPQFHRGYPRVSDQATGETSLAVDVSMKRPSTVFYAVLGKGSPTPSVQEVQSGLGGNAVAFGSILVKDEDGTGKGLSASALIENLKPATGYRIFFVAQDPSEPSAVSPSPVSVHSEGNSDSDVVYTKDQTPPSFTAEPRQNPYPGNAEDSVTVEVQVDEPCTCHYAVVEPESADKYSSADIISGAIEAAFASSFKVRSGEDSLMSALDALLTTPQRSLKPSTAYTVLMVPEDSSGNYDPTPTAVQVYTPDLTPPTFLDGMPIVEDETEESVTVRTGLSEPGVVSYVLLDGSTQHADPSLEDVLAFRGSQGQPPVASGTIQVGEERVAEAELSGLRTAYPYNLFLALQDLAEAPFSSKPNVNPEVKKISVMPPDLTPPTFEVSLGDVGETNATLEVRSDETGIAYYVVLDQCGSSEVACAEPSEDQIRAGHGASGESPVDAGSFLLSALSAMGGRHLLAEESMLAGANSTISGHMAPRKNYSVFVTAADDWGNLAQRRRLSGTTTDTTPPVITLLGANPVNLTVLNGSNALSGYTAYTDAGATALDNVDGDLTTK